MTSFGALKYKGSKQSCPAKRPCRPLTGLGQFPSAWGNDQFLDPENHMPFVPKQAKSCKIKQKCTQAKSYNQATSGKNTPCQKSSKIVQKHAILQQPLFSSKNAIKIMQTKQSQAKSRRAKTHAKSCKNKLLFKGPKAPLSEAKIQPLQNHAHSCHAKNHANRAKTSYSLEARMPLPSPPPVLGPTLLPFRRSPYCAASPGALKQKCTPKAKSCAAKIMQHRAKTGRSSAARRPLLSQAKMQSSKIMQTK